MASARCPVCEDILTIGVALKLYQPVTCPTCLANLQVVSVNPFELELASSNRRNYQGRNGQSQNHKKTRQDKPAHRVSDYFGGEDDFDDYDDFTLERRLRLKSDPERRKAADR
jgi:Alpha-aminoadipate carrier protein LysW-like, globular domain